MKQEIQELVDKIIHEEDASLRDKLSSALIDFKWDAIEFILPELKNKDWAVRYRMAKIIHAIGVTDKDTFLCLESILEQEKDEYVRETLLKSLLGSKIEIVTPFLHGEENDDLISLSLFSADESENIKNIFVKNDINFREFVVCYGHPDYDSYREEVIFEVPKKQLETAVKTLLLEFFGLGSGSSYTGECPACSVHVESVTVCPECELSLEMDPLDALHVHRFSRCLATLLENGLVDKNILEG